MSPMKNPTVPSREYPGIDSSLAYCGNCVNAGKSCLVAVVGQRYAVNVMDEHVLRGNAAIIKCHIPSFVAEFVEVDSWVEDDTTDIYPSPDYGTFTHGSFHLFNHDVTYSTTGV